MPKIPTLDELKRKKLEVEIESLEARRDLWRAERKRVEAEAVAYEKEVEEGMASEDEAHIFAFHGQVGDQSVRGCMERLGNWSRRPPQEGGEKKPFTIQLYSPGGGVIPGFALIDYITGLRADGHEVNTECYGYCASMGGVLLQAGGHRTMSKHSYLMIHELSSMEIGKISELEDEVKFSKRLYDRCLALLAERSSLTPKEIERKAKRKDWWIDAQEALDLGFCDEVR
jgi:ATP-dependent protease ClpP protease subunit